jgi:hypothetical protein
MKLAIYPRKVSDVINSLEDQLGGSNSNTNLKANQKHKLNRVLSCDKNIFKSKLAIEKTKDSSELNRGVFIGRLRSNRSISNN